MELMLILGILAAVFFVPAKLLEQFELKRIERMTPEERAEYEKMCQKWRLLNLINIAPERTLFLNNTGLRTVAKKRPKKSLKLTRRARLLLYVNRFGSGFVS